MGKTVGNSCFILFFSFFFPSFWLPALFVSIVFSKLQKKPNEYINDLNKMSYLSFWSTLNLQNKNKNPNLDCLIAELTIYCRVWGGLLQKHIKNIIWVSKTLAQCKWEETKTCQGLNTSQEHKPLQISCSSKSFKSMYRLLVVPWSCSLVLWNLKRLPAQ